MKSYIYEKGSMHENKFRLEVLPPPPYFEVSQHYEDKFVKNPLECESKIVNEFNYKHGIIVFAFVNNKPIKIGGNIDSSD